MNGYAGVVVTGVGLALSGGVRSAAELAATVDPAGGTPVALDQPADPAARIGRKGLRYKDRATQLALVAADDALRDCGVLTGTGLGVSVSVDATSVAVAASSNFGNLDTVTAMAGQIAAEGGTRLLSPILGPILSSNVIAAETAIRFGLRGPNVTICNGDTGGLDAMHWAATLLRAERADFALVVGVEPGNDVVRALVGHEHILDGAAALVLEREQTARERGARVHARVGRYARSGELAECLRALADDEPSPAGWYLPAAPTQPPGGAEPAQAPQGTLRFDVERVWGSGSGATGVLSCAAAVGRFAAGAPGAVYALAPAADACAGLILRPGDE